MKQNSNTTGSSYKNIAEMPILATLPWATLPVATPTYAGQVPAGSRVVMTLGATDRVTAALLGKVEPRVKSAAEECLLEKQLELELLASQLESLAKSAAKRAKMFLDYATQGVGFEVLVKVRAGTGQLTSREIDEFVGPVYDVLRKEAGATSSFKAAVREYIRSGRLEPATLLWLATKVNREFQALITYESLSSELRQISQSTGISELEKVLTKAVDALRSGKPLEEVKAGGLDINVYHELRQLLEADPTKPFLMELAAASARAEGLIVPFCHKPAEAKSVCDELGLYYLPVEKLGHIITLFDTLIRKVADHYAEGHAELTQLLDEIYTRRGILVNTNVIVRALFAEDHNPTLALYPDWRLRLSGAYIQRVIELVRNNRAELLKVAAKHLGLQEEEFNFQTVLELQTRLMQLLPMPFYDCAAIRATFLLPMAEAKRQLSHYTAEGRALILNYDSYERKLQRDFGVTLEKVIDATDKTAEEALKLFGKGNFNFQEKGRV